MRLLPEGGWRELQVLLSLSRVTIFCCQGLGIWLLGPIIGDDLDVAARAGGVVGGVLLGEQVLESHDGLLHCRK